jgi:DNA-binding transcriptional regulator YhcF (GntR family)|tara:strand:+ start:1211 stop:1594 length:384 start_codon:yes stop_codon:yes gene_type:complete
MSSKYVFNAIKCKNLTAIEKLIYICLSSRADEKGICYPSVATIAKDAICSSRTVHRSLRELERKKYIKSKPNYINGDKTAKRTSNIYTVCMTELHPTTDTMADKTKQYKQVLRGHYVTGTNLSSIAG